MWLRRTLGRISLKYLLGRNVFFTFRKFAWECEGCNARWFHPFNGGRLRVEWVEVCKEFETKDLLSSCLSSKVKVKSIYKPSGPLEPELKPVSVAWSD